MRWLVLGVFVFAPVLGAETTVVRCGKLLDVVSGEMRSNVDVTVEGNAITKVGPAGAGAPTVDLSRGYCMPGLIDVHDHITSDPQHSGYASLGISVPRETVIGVKNARNTLRAGFTTVRNVGASGYSDIAIRDGILEGEIEGPRMFASGPAIGITGGHCDQNLLAPEFKYTDPGVADGPWAARAKVDRKSVV